MATTLKALCRSRDLKFGHFIVEFATPGIGHILKNAGCDFVLFDTEHSGFGFETIKSAMRYFRGGATCRRSCGCRPRNTSHRPRRRHGGGRASCCRWSTRAEEAARSSHCMKYMPQGRRGVALGVAHDDYRAGPVPEKLAGRQRAHHLFAQIETAPASRTPTPSPRSTASTACGSAISTSAPRSASRRSSSTRTS